MSPCLALRSHALSRYRDKPSHSRNVRERVSPALPRYADDADVVLDADLRPERIGLFLDRREDPLRIRPRGDLRATERRDPIDDRSEEHTSELQSLAYL